MLPIRKTWVIAAVALCLLYSCTGTRAADEVKQPTPAPAKYGVVGPNESLPGNLCVFHANVPEGAKPVWVIIPPEAASRLYVDSSGLQAVFASREAGEYYLAMAATIDGATQIFTHELVNRSPDPEPKPDPKPDPDPDPTPVPGKKFVLVMIESHERGEKYASALMGLRGYAAEKGHTYRAVDPDGVDEKGERPAWLAEYQRRIEAAKVPLPALVVGDISGDSVLNISVKPMPETSAAAVEILKARGG